MSFLQGLCIFSIILLSNGLTFATIKKKAEAIRLVREGQNVVEVARRLNTSPEKVSDWVQAAEAVRLARETQNYAEVARRLNTSLETVYKWIRSEEQKTGWKIIRQRFTPEQKAEAIQLAGETQDFAEVARRFNTTPDNVRKWVRDDDQRTTNIQLYRQRQYFTPKQKAEAVQLARETQNYAEVARKLNTSSKNVHNWVRAEEQRTGQQIVPQQQRFTPEQKAEAVRSVREGQSVAEVARELNTSQQNVRNWVQRINDIIEKLEEYGFSNEIQEAIKSDIPPFTMARNNIEDIIKHIEEIRETCTEALTEDNLI